MGRTSDARDRIVRAAARLFLTRSYDGVSVEELCAEADVRKGSFYYYFASKPELAAAVVDFHIDALIERFDQVRGDAAVPRLHGLADTIGAVQYAYEKRFGRIVGCPFGNLAAELSTIDELIQARLAAAFARWEGHIADICRQAEREGTLRPGLDPDRFARALLAQAQGQILLAKATNGAAADISAALHDLIDSSTRKVASR
jgi:TetR/AcrR family transcriptional repressor of nem operon